MAYKPIESYGVIGDLHTIALVGMDGSIDWCACHASTRQASSPQFSTTARGLLQDRQLYEDAAQADVPARQQRAGDALPQPRRSRRGGRLHAGRGRPAVAKTHQIVRVVRAVRGAVRFRLECRPAFDYARRPHQVTLEGRGAVFEAPGYAFLRWSAAFRWRVRVTGWPPSSCCTRASRRRSSCASSNAMATGAVGGALGRQRAR